MQDKLNKKVEDALNSLDGIERASAPPFFFTRLEARMQREKNVWDKISSFIARPVFAIATICLVIMINASVIFSQTQNTDNNDKQNELATVDEYNQLNSSFYEFVNAKP